MPAKTPRDSGKVSVFDEEEACFKFGWRPFDLDPIYDQLPTYEDVEELTEEQIEKKYVAAKSSDYPAE